jgi:hypothetical protein
MVYISPWAANKRSERPLIGVKIRSGWLQTQCDVQLQ